MTGVQTCALPISHAHFYHLHRPSLRAIVQNNLRVLGTAPAIVIPSHVTDLISDLGFSEIIELDWWNTSRHGSLSVTHVPSRHWGARILRDSHRGYGGYVLRAGRHSVYHAGDTAYFAGFREIGRRLSPELALLPIGAYKPAWFMGPVHMSPAEALAAHRDLGAGTSVGMHYGTFQLADDGEEEPVQEIERLLAESAPPKPRFWLLDPGEGRDVPA